jgi:uncharacterized membrane protein
MTEWTGTVAAWAAGAIELVGVAVIVTFTVYALVGAGVGFARGEDCESLYVVLRQRLARGILLGLELLVAGDIIHTVAVDLTFRTVAVLAVVVLIRTFLSFTIEVEIEGRWPWQRERDRQATG